MPGKHKKPERKAYDKKLGDRLDKLRRLKAMSQKELASVVGVDQPAMSRLLNGTQTFSPDQLDRAAKALGVLVRDVLPEGHGSPYAPDFPQSEEGGLPPVEEWPEGLAGFLERHAERLQIGDRERWRLATSRFRAEPWQKFDDAFWADMLTFWRTYWAKREKPAHHKG